MALKDTAHFIESARGATQGRRVLLAWELGEGLGHAARLLLIATRLRSLGWQPVVAARNPSALAPRYAAAGIPVIAAPSHRSCFTGPGSFQAVTYADVMGVCGYADPHQLAASMAAWDQVLARHAPDVIVADYAPLLSLAAFGRVPVIGIGDGFVTPHGLPDGRFPALRPDASPVWDPEILLGAARQVQAARGLPQPDSLPQIMEGAGQVVSVLPELDVYADTRPAPAAGPWEAASSPLPPPAGVRVFSYLHMSHPLARVMLQALVDAQVPGECYLHEAPAPLVASVERAGIRVHATPPVLRHALRDTSFLVHHGGIGSMEEAVLAGRPQLLLPRHLEQSLNAARAIASFRGAWVVRPDASLDQLRQRLPVLLHRSGPLQAAQQAAERLSGRRGTAWDALQRLLARVTDARGVASAR